MPSIAVDAAPPPMSPRSAVLGPRPRLSSNGSVSDWLPWLSLDVPQAQPLPASTPVGDAAMKATRRIFGDRSEDLDRLRAFAGL